MTNKVYRIQIDVDAYHLTEDEYQKRIAEIEFIYNGWFRGKRNIPTPEEMKQSDLENAIREASKKIYESPKNARIRISHLKSAYNHIGFYIEEAELNWNRTDELY